MRRFTVVIGCAVAAATLAARLAAAPSWIEVRSPHFTVVSDAGDGHRHEISPGNSNRFAAPSPMCGPGSVTISTGRSSWSACSQRRVDEGAHTRAVQNGQAFASVTATGRDRHYLVVQTDLRANGPEGVNPYRDAFWSYAALGLEASANRGFAALVHQRPS